jgi:hypothetical protein
MKEVEGKKFEYEGKVVICGTRNNKSKKVFKAKNSKGWMGRDKGVFIRTTEMVIYEMELDFKRRAI